MKQNIATCTRSKNYHYKCLAKTHKPTVKHTIISCEEEELLYKNYYLALIIAQPIKCQTYNDTTKNK
jgi:hypothetical protein